MPIPWENIEALPEYQELPDWQKATAKQTYWKRFIEPDPSFSELTPDQRRVARDNFFADIPYQPEIHQDTAPEPGFFKKLIGGGDLTPADKAKAVGQLVSEEPEAVRLPVPKPGETVRQPSIGGGIGEALMAGKEDATQYHWIGALKQAGLDFAKFPSDVLSGIGTAIPKVAEQVEKAGALPGLPGTAARLIGIAGKAAKPLAGVGETGKEYYEGIAEKSPEIKAFRKAVAEGKESIWSQALGAAGNLAGGVGVAMIPGVGPLAAGAGFFSLNKDEAYQTAKDKLLKAGVPEAEADKRAEKLSWATGAINSVLDTVGAGRIAHVFSPARKLMNFLTGALVTSQIEGGTEAVQSIVTQINADYAVKPEGESSKEFIKKTVKKLPEYAKNAGADYLIGTILGGAGHVAGETVSSSMRKKPKSVEDQQMKALNKLLDSKDLTVKALEDMRKTLPDDSSAAKEIDNILGNMPSRRDTAKQTITPKQETIELKEVVRALPVKKEGEIAYPKDITGPRVKGLIGPPEGMPDWGPPEPGPVPAGREALAEPPKRLPPPKPKQLPLPPATKGPEGLKQFGEVRGKPVTPPG